MGELRIRDVDEGLVSELKRQAKRHGRTLGEEVREVLTREAYRSREQIVERLQHLRDQIRAKHGELPDSTPGIRAERDSRG